MNIKQYIEGTMVHDLKLFYGWDILGTMMISNYTKLV